MARPRSRYSFVLSEETLSRLRIIAGVTRSTENEVIETAVNLLYNKLPKDLDTRMTLKALVGEEEEESDGERT